MKRTVYIEQENGLPTRFGMVMYGLALWKTKEQCVDYLKGRLQEAQEGIRHYENKDKELVPQPGVSWFMSQARECQELEYKIRKVIDFLEGRVKDCTWISFWES